MWRVEILDAVVAAEIEALPEDIQAAFLRLSERIQAVGLERIREPHAPFARQAVGNAVLWARRNWPRDLCDGNGKTHRRCACLYEENAEDALEGIGVGRIAVKGGFMTIPFEAFREKLLKNPKVRTEYERLGPVYDMIGALIEARHEAGLTQSELASRMGTKQSVIARLENAHRLPSLEMVMRYAAAVGRRVALQ